MAPLAFSSCRKAPASTRCVVTRSQADRRAIASAGVAAAVLLATTPAFAGVTFAEKPNLKNYASSKEPAAPAEPAPLPNPADKLKGAFKAATGGEPKKEEGPKKAEPAAPGDSFNTQSLWPLGLVAVGGALFAAPKVDSGFDKMFETAWVKDSSANAFGIGTENVLKEKGGYMASYYPAGEPEKGTKAIKKQRDPKKVPGKRQKKGFL